MVYEATSFFLQNIHEASHESAFNPGTQDTDSRADSSPMAPVNVALLLLLVGGADAFSGSGDFVKRIPSTKVPDSRRSGHMMIDRFSQRATNEGSQRRRCLPNGSSSGGSDIDHRHLYRTENQQVNAVLIRRVFPSSQWF